ncbi:maleylacetoacetate isomerase [Zoogloea sp.]|uniref:maleylacetoacetate isomerase n=1 Tax=Zoogloea sp. TaxID=49181 RepID=UPI001415CB86|nr:MAG: maleylacetoacetate isomerase [Zoogloea sp.]
MQLYNFFRSSSSHRLRIALNLKGLDYDYVAVDLRREEHLEATFKALNPQGLVPALSCDDGVLIQSPAILEWLEDRYPTLPLLPADPASRARVRALAAIIGCDIHPINNRRILEYLRHTLGADEDVIQAWCGEWIHAGFQALEALLAADPGRGRFCFGHTPTLADVYLIPQVESARRFEVDLTPYPRILAIDEACARLPTFSNAAPARQPDAPRSRT